MHAIYHYLMHLEPADGESLDMTALHAFERYAEDHLDDNNWWVPIDLVMKDGGYLHQFDGEVSDRYGASDKPIAWDDAVRFALDCVVTDFEIRGQPYFDFVKRDEKQKKDEEAYNRLFAREVISFVHTEVPKLLTEAYKKLIGQPWNCERKFEAEEYRRARLSRQYELFRDAVTVPFSSTVKSPYAYRAYDLTESYAEGEPNAILRLDIHT